MTASSPHCVYRFWTTGKVCDRPALKGKQYCHVCIRKPDVIAQQAQPTQGITVVLDYDPNNSGNIVVSGRWDATSHQLLPLTDKEREVAQNMGLITTTPMEL